MVKKFKFCLSVIIPTFKRSEKLKKIVTEIFNQSPSSVKIEIIIIGNEDKNIKILFNKLIRPNIKIRFFSVNKNSNAVKRNKGIMKAKGKNLILIDDDCLPDRNFIRDYLKLFKKIKDNNILCGSVKYFRNKIKNEHFIRYRQSRHFINKKSSLTSKNHLQANQIVTMNMGMKNSKLLKKTKYFNEKFGGYGFEDYEFGFRLINLGFKFIPTKPLVYHLDERNYRSYLNKIYYLSRFSVIHLKKINYDSWKNTIYYKIENNFFVNFFSKINIFYYLFKILEKLIEFIEQNIFLYFPNLYRFGIFLSYCRGYYDRKGLIKNKNYDWYK